jgi:RHS repeat-associated protein
VGYDAWGNVRYVTGTLPTDIGYTGQRGNLEVGLLFYRARFYAPYLNRWLSPDTIVPDPQNPQGLNRYSYVNNRPLNFADPTGHMMDDGCHTEGCGIPKADRLQTEALAQQKYYGYYSPCQQHGGPGCSTTATAIMNTKDFVESAAKTLDKLSNSGVGLQGGGCAGGDAGVGLEGCVSAQFLINLRAGQIGIFISTSGAMKVGVPNGLSASAQVGLAVAPGVSDLNALNGSGAVQGADANLDALFEAGIYGQRSESFDDKGQPRIDPVTGMPITTLSAGGQVGANQIPTVIDGGIRAGTLRTFGCVVSLSGILCQGF